MSEEDEEICVQRFLSWYNEQQRRNYTYKRAEKRFCDLKGGLRWEFVAYEPDNPEKWIGIEVKDLSGAKALAHQQPDGRYQFQWWALGLIGARPLGEKKKGTDKGIDGVIHFIDEPSGKPRRVVVQVKSGHVGVNAVRELKAVVANDAIGVLISLEPPTGPMKVEAVEAGFYHSPVWNKDYPKIQILTIEELLKGKTVDMPPQTQTSVTFAKAQKISKQEGEQLSME